MPAIDHRRVRRTAVVALALAAVLVLGVGPSRPGSGHVAPPQGAGRTAATVDAHLSVEGAHPLRLERSELADHGRWLPLLVVGLVGLAAVASRWTADRSSAAALVRWRRATARFRRGPPGLQLT